MNRFAWPVAVLAIAVVLSAGMVLVARDLRATHAPGEPRATATIASRARSTAGSTAPPPAFRCTVTPGTGGQETYQVDTASGAAYAGLVEVTFHDYAGSGHIFPPARLRGVAAAGSAANSHAVPAADIGAAAAPSGCIARAAAP